VASVSKDGRGWRILFTAPDGRRRTLRLGRVDRKAAESIRYHVENLIVAKTAGVPVRQETAVWLAGIGSKLRERLVRCGLCDAAPTMTLERLLNSFLDAHTTVAPGTRVVWAQVMKDLREFFGPDCDVTRLTIDDAERFRLYLKARGLADYTIVKRLQKTRQFFHYAVRREWMSRNPFLGITHSGGNPADRRVYVPVNHVLRVMEHCPNNTWRLLVALARFGGLRIPSEAFSLRWIDVDWERSRLTVPSPKTASRGQKYRIIPLFPLLRPYLETAWDEAPEGADFVIPEEYRRRSYGPGGWRNANLRTTLERIVRRAGLEPWPRLWHNLRASFESDLAQAFPLATVTKWLGNSPSIALRHYVDPTDTAFEQAAQWIPPLGVHSEHSHSGAKSGALVAQKAAPQIPAGNGKIENDAF
jgi:integrase